MRQTWIILLVVMLALAFVAGCSKTADDDGADEGAGDVTEQPATPQEDTQPVDDVTDELLDENVDVDIGDVI